MRMLTVQQKKGVYQLFKDNKCAELVMVVGLFSVTFLQNPVSCAIRKFLCEITAYGYINV